MSFENRTYELFEFELSNSNYAYYISPPLIKNRFKISGYCFLLIIPPIFTPLFITRMNCFDHLNTLGSSLFFYQNVNVFIKRILWEAQFYCCHFCQVDDMEDSVIFN